MLAKPGGGRGFSHLCRRGGRCFMQSRRLDRAVAVPMPGASLLFFWRPVAGSLRSAVLPSAPPECHAPPLIYLRLSMPPTHAIAVAVPTPRDPALAVRQSKKSWSVVALVEAYRGSVAQGLVFEFLQTFSPCPCKRWRCLNIPAMFSQGSTLVLVMFSDESFPSNFILTQSFSSLM